MDNHRRRGHKLAPEVVAFAAETLRKDPTLGTAAIWPRFGVRVHPRSVQRALARQASSAEKERKR